MWKEGSPTGRGPFVGLEKFCHISVDMSNTVLSGRVFLYRKVERV